MRPWRKAIQQTITQIADAATKVSIQKTGVAVVLPRRKSMKMTEQQKQLAANKTRSEWRGDFMVCKLSVGFRRLVVDALW
jgi:hypothetical protein